MIKEFYNSWTPFEILWNLEWWEILGLINVITDNHKKIKDETEKINRKYNRYSHSGKQNIEYEPIDSWKPRKKLSDYAKEMREKILRGEL